MKKNIAFIFLFFASFLVRSQSINIGYLRIISKSSAVVPIINAKTGSDGTDNSFSFIYEHFIVKKKYSIITSYSKYNGCTLIHFEDGGWIGTDGNSISAYGFCGGVKIHRFDLGIAYNLTKQGEKFYFKPCVFLGIQKSVKTEVSFWGDGEPVNGPNYFELEPMSAEPLNTIQLVPSFGFRTGFVFWKRLDISLGVQGVYALKPYQKMYLKYQYKGIVQPMAEYESTGTGIFVTLGVGYRFAKLIK